LNAPRLQLFADRRPDDAWIDAIVIHTSGQEGWQKFLRLLGIRNSFEPRIPTAHDRLDRYQTAACLYPLHADPYKAKLREELGELFLDGWKRGKRPQLRLIANQMPASKKRRHLRAVG
jgi:hypothetical protein